MKSWYFTCVWKLVAFQVMMSGPSDLFTGSGCEASRKKKPGKTHKESKGDVHTSMESYDVVAKCVCSALIWTSSC